MKKIEVRKIDTVAFQDLFREHREQFFENESQIFRLRDALSEKEWIKIESLKSNMGKPLRINLGLYHENKFIGWSWGYQESAFRFYMCNSAVFPEFRRKGLYTRLLNEIVSRVNDLGFQEIYSKHTITNNAVIIPKLKADFIISSIEISDLFGTLVTLSYYQKELRRKILDYRVGETKPDTEIRKYLSI